MYDCYHCGRPTGNSPQFVNAVPAGAPGNYGAGAIPIYRSICNRCTAGLAQVARPPTPEEQARHRAANERYLAAVRQWELDVTSLLAQCEPVERFVRIRAEFPRTATRPGPGGRPMLYIGLTDDVVRRIVGLPASTSWPAMPDGLADWFLDSVKTPPTHPEIVVAEMRKGRMFDGLRRLKGAAESSSSLSFLSSDPRYSDRTVTGWVFASGQTNCSGRPLDIAITKEGEVVRELSGFGRVFWHELPTFHGGLSFGSFNDDACAKVVAVLGLPPLPARPDRS